MNVQFGGGLATILEPKTGVQLHPRCMGNASVLGAADETTVKASIIKQVGLQIIAAMKLGQTFQQSIAGASLASAVGAAVSAELATSVQITLLNVMVGDDELAALRGGGPMSIAQNPTTAAPAVIGPGSRVIATWQDGRSAPATVRSFNGTQYEIMWDGATTTTWIPANAVRPA
jgi:hypothetical protein